MMKYIARYVLHHLATVNKVMYAYVQKIISGILPWMQSFPVVLA